MKTTRAQVSPDGSHGPALFRTSRRRGWCCHVEVFLAVEELLEPVQDYLVIVDEHDADRH